MRTTLWMAALLAVGCGDDGGAADAAAGPDAADGGPSGDAGPGDAGAGDAGGGDAGDAGGGDPVCPLEGFAACGGDVVGRWTVIAFCPEDEEAFQALCESPFSDRPACVGGGNTQHCTFHRTGTLELAADLSFDFPLTAMIASEYVFDDACLADIGMGGTPDAECTRLGEGRLDCAYTTDRCACTSVTDPEDQTTAGTYSIAGTVLTLDFGGGKTATAGFCVDGDRLDLDVTPHPVAWRYWRFRRE